MSDLMNEMTLNMLSEMHEKREALVKEMLIKKGYGYLLNTEKTRFPKISRTIAPDGWEYIFADNKSKQGAFIVAIGPWEPSTNFDFSKRGETYASSEITYNFKWQDKNFDAVRLP